MLVPQYQRVHFFLGGFPEESDFLKDTVPETKSQAFFIPWGYVTFVYDQKPLFIAVWNLGTEFQPININFNLIIESGGWYVNFS